MLTTRGWALGLTAALALAAAVAFGVEELYLVAATAAALLAFGAAWVHLHRVGVSAERRLRPGRVGAGEAALVELTLVNASRRRSPLLGLHEPFTKLPSADAGAERGPPSGLARGRGAAFRLAPMAPGTRLSSAYRLPPAARGRYLVGPLQLRLVDPFGLTRRTRTGAGVSVLTVHPRVATLRDAPQARGHDRFGRAGRWAQGAGGEEFSSLRPYREGDDLRRVHWPSTARLDRVIVRQTDAVAAPRATVAVDLRAGLWAPAGLEEALAAAGGVLDVARRAGIDIRLVTTTSGDGGTLDTGFGRSQAHWAQVLDALAVAEPEAAPAMAAGARPLAGQLGEAARVANDPAEDTLTVITSSRADQAELRGLGRLALPSSLIVVAFTQPGDPAGARPDIAGRYVEVIAPGTFAEAWAEMSAARGRLVTH